MAERRRVQARSAESDDPYAQPVSALRRILIDTRVYDELGRDWSARERPDLCDRLLRGHRHASATSSRRSRRRGSRSVGGRLRALPRRAGALLHARSTTGSAISPRSPKSTGSVLMLASDHGFLWKEGRPTTLSSDATTTAAKWHRSEGMYLLWGPGIGRVAGTRGRGSVQQVCATLLALLGLPPGARRRRPAARRRSGAAAARVDYSRCYTPRPRTRPAAPPTRGGRSRHGGEAESARLRRRRRKSKGRAPARRARRVATTTKG